MWPQYQMLIKRALHVGENCTETWVRRMCKSLRIAEHYIVCKTWNLVGPGRFVIDGFNDRISVLDEVVEQPEILHIEYRGWRLYLRRYF